MENPNASVIVCVHNRPMEIEACLQSLLETDYSGFEIVVVDDASTDGTPVRLEEFRRTHPELTVRIVRNDRNKGVSGARNAGVGAAKGELVFFTDSDCLVGREWLRAMAAGFHDPTVAAVSGPIVDPTPTTWTQRAYVGTSRIAHSSLQRRKLSGGNMGFRRALLQRHLFDEALRYGCDEDDIARRMQAHGHRIIRISDAPVQHVHPLNLRSYLDQGLRQGRGAARFWYKHGIYIGRDLWAVAGAVLSAPLCLVHTELLVVPAAFLALQTAAIIYNEHSLKGKGWWETLCVLPLCVLYYLCKSWGVFATFVRLLLGKETEIRASKRRWVKEKCGLGT